MADNQYKLTSTDRVKWLTNAGLFAAPVALIYLMFIQTNITLDGFQYTDFRPNEFVIGSMVTYVISSLIDLTKKFVSKS